MDQRNTIRFSDFQRALTVGALRSVQIIQAAIGLGIVMFGGVILFLYLNSRGQERIAHSATAIPFRYLTWAHISLAVVVYGTANVLYRMIIRRCRTLGGVEELSSTDSYRTDTNVAEECLKAEKCVGAMRAAIIVRLGMYEGVAFFGLVICMLGMTEGIFETTPIYLVNLFSPAILILTVAATFPTRGRLEGLFRRHISDLY
jgi:hypothetical protein